MASFFGGPFFRQDSRLSLEGPGCQPLTDDFDYERLGRETKLPAGFRV